MTEEFEFEANVLFDQDNLPYIPLPFTFDEMVEKYALFRDENDEGWKIKVKVTRIEYLRYVCGCEYRNDPFYRVVSYCNLHNKVKKQED